MKNGKMYCLCLKNENLNTMKRLGYIPVGLGANKFSNEWVRDNTYDNISTKNRYYGEYTFHYWFWKNVFPKIEDNTWIGFCAYREYWGNKKKVKTYINEDVYKTIPKARKKYIKIIVEYNGPVEAPIKKHDVLGNMKIFYKDELLKKYDVLALENIKKVNIFSRIVKSINYLIWGDV